MAELASQPLSKLRKERREAVIVDWVQPPRTRHGWFEGAMKWHIVTPAAAAAAAVAFCYVVYVLRLGRGRGEGEMKSVKAQ